MSHAVGSLVKARGREWVVLPDSTDDLLIVKPLGGTQAEITGIYIPLEKVESATFELPDPTQNGDYRSCRLLRDATKLGFRSSAGPFRSFARISVEPRPYQLVPLLMALKLDPVRILIADDVGIGKTIEACSIARELIDRGEEERMAVLCPPHLAEQWQKELNDKFHIPAELVLSSTATRLERNCAVDQSLFDVYPFTVVSMDYIKTSRRRDEFLRTCPNLVIVDEAHTCSFAAAGRGGRHLRYDLIKKLSKKEERHLILVTATPHSGKDEAFRSLLEFLNPEFEHLPDDISGKQNEHLRRNLAQHFIQRQRADIRNYLDADTEFPERFEKEETYGLSAEYKALFDKVIEYAKETVTDEDDNKRHQRVRWWSALALLRSLASSPAAAASTLRNRAAPADTDSVEDADEIGRRQVMDLDDDDTTESMDIAPGSDIGELADDEKKNRRRLNEMARLADALKGDKDKKLLGLVDILKDLLKDGYHPIVFCRFIPTAEYVAEELRNRMKKVEITAITGNLPHADRETRVEELAKHEKRILVATDCLSEGINLQKEFDAVIHYDLSWNPTRHEQRAGRVDRFGQSRDIVRVLTYWGEDNKIDGIVLDVLLRKHNTIKKSLGISVPVPPESDKLVEAIFEGLLFRGSQTADQLRMFDDFFKEKYKEFESDWTSIIEREKKSRTMFAQETIKTEEVSRELKAAREAIGSGVDVGRFLKEGLELYNGVASGDDPVKFDLTETPMAVREVIGNLKEFKAQYEMPVKEGIEYITRTHPIVEGLATYMMETSLDSEVDSVAKRAGVIRTSGVDKRTTILLVRNRYQIKTTRGKDETQLLAEDCNVLGFTGSPQSAEWLDETQVEEILQSIPDENVPSDQATQFLTRIINDFDNLYPHLNAFAEQHGEELLDAHKRVRKEAKATGVKITVKPKLPPDILGLYIYLPKN